MATYKFFDEATTYPCIINISKNQSGKNIFAYKVNTLKFENGFKNYLKNNEEKIEYSDLGEDSWNLSSLEQKVILKKIKKISIPLLNFINGEAYRGILTGLSEAFIIDSETKENIVKIDPKAEFLIKPFLLGRNIKPYFSLNSEKWLILIPKGYTIKNNLPINDPYKLYEPPPRYGEMAYSDAWEWFNSYHPSLAKHLLPFKKKAEARTDKGDFWWELRACDYYGQFEKPKIMYQVFQVKPCFIFDEKSLFCNNSMWIIPTDDKFLLGLLNSKLGWWLISKYCTAIQNGFQLIWKYFGQIPITNNAKNKGVNIENLVNKIISIKKGDPRADISQLEAEIDLQVYHLYQLTYEDVKIIDPEFVLLKDEYFT